jgi:Xaa-Pro aminopeptidase
MNNASPPHANRLFLLRNIMKKLRLNAYLVPRQDRFQGEYVPASEERLFWLTGFGGSWGCAIVSTKEAVLLVDGRYTVQAKEQVDIKSFRVDSLIENPPHKWLTSTLKKGDRFGFDPWLTTIADAEKLKVACQSIGASLIPVASNLIDQIWDDRPEMEKGSISVHASKYAGRSAEDKLKSLRETLRSLGADAVVLCEPSSTSWLFNLRGKDIPYTPVIAAFSIVTRKGNATVFTSPAQESKAVSDHLDGLAVLKPSEGFEKHLNKLGKAAVLLDPSATPERVRLILAKAGARIVLGGDPCTLPRAQKNQVEQDATVRAHVRDGVAMVKFLYWFDAEGTGQDLNEYEIAQKLLAFRREAPELVDLSFSTISAAGPNAASPHYSVKPDTARRVETNQVYLVDSGAQYRDGTTDITRTLFVGHAPREFKMNFTAVLKGMIQVSLLRFPEGTTGSQIDAHARAALWKMGLDYDHGTGHGVGSFLSVHEGPQRINKTSLAALRTGMIVSNEPGYYRQGEYGIRIENLLLVKKPEQIEGGDRAMLGFQTLTLCPIDRRLIDTSMLTREELAWLDTYHAHVWRTLRPLVDGPVANWLTKACAPIK